MSQFRDEGLLPQVQTALGSYKTADKAELETELAKVIAQAQALGVEHHRLRIALESDLRLIANLVWKSRQFLDSRAISRVSNDHEYVVAFGASGLARFRGASKDLTK